MQTIFSWHFRTLIVLVQLKLVYSAEVTNIQVEGNAVKGQQVVIVCSISNFNVGEGVFVRQAVTKELLDRPMVVCNGNNGCLDRNPYSTRYSFISNSSSITSTISNCNRLEDEKVWDCASVSSQSSKELFLIIYTKPDAVNLTASPNRDIDLSLESVNFTCATTNCVSPAPNFTWYVTENGQSSQRYTVSNTGHNTGTNCQENEQMYISTFTLKQYKTSSGNQDKTVKFQCRIDRFPGITSNLSTLWSGNVRYAINVTTVNLTADGSTPNDTITVGSGVQSTLTCTPGTSRPTATVVWYIGESVIQNGSKVLNYAFKYEDNNKQIYCKTSNIPEVEVNSTKHKLYVRVEVSSVLFKDTDLDNGTKVIVISGSSHTLTCIPSPCQPAATVTWYVGGVNRTSSNSIYNFTFIPTDDDHNKPIYCTAFNIEATVTSEKPVLYVKVNAGTPSLLNSTTGDQALLVNDEVSLVCVTNNTRPAANVTWKGINVSNVTNVPTPVGRDLVWVTSTVTFVPTISDNNKNITCEAKIDGLSTTAAVPQRLEIWWPPSIPSITTVSPSFPWKEGITNSSLTCNTTTDEGNPKATVSWSSSVGTSDPSNANRLIVSNVTYEHDEANVVCQLTNGYTKRKGNPGVTSSITKLDINFSPKVLTNDSRYLAAVGDSVNFSISSYCKPKKIYSVNVTSLNESNSRSPFNVSWTPDTVNTPTHGAVKGCIIYLQISNVTLNDYGNYTVVLSNSAGISIWTFSFKPYGKPQTVTNFRHINNVNGFSIFYMEGGFNEGVTQEFIIELSVDGLKWIEKLQFWEDNTDYKLPNGSYSFNISELQPNTYLARVISKNYVGTSEVSEYVTFTIETQEAESKAVVGYKPTVAIAGGVVGGIAVIIATIILLVLLEQRTGRISHMIKSKKPEKHYVNQDMETVNPAYSTTDVLVSHDASKRKAVTTNKATKKAKSKAENKTAANATIYSLPDKSRQPHYFDIYSQVDKTNTKTTLPSKTEKKMVKSEKPLPPILNVSAEGCVYADLELKKSPPKAKIVKPTVGHVVDRNVIYEPIDFSRKAEPYAEEY